MTNLPMMLFTAEQTNEIVDLAWRDPIFKRALLDVPTHALSRFLNLDLPSGLTLRVVEETASTLYLVVPATLVDPNLVPTATMETRIAWRMRHDPAFRQALLTNPATALQDAFGMPFPEHMTVRVLEETQGLRYLVLPLDPSMSLAEQELSDVELMAVAGGGRSLRPDFSCKTTKDVTVRSLNPEVTRRRRSC